MFSMLAEIILIAGIVHFFIIQIQLVLYILNRHKRKIFSNTTKNNNYNLYSNVVVLIPVCNEKSSILKDTLIKCKQLENNPYIIVIENSSSNLHKQSNIQICVDLNINYVSIPNLGNKAKALNYYLSGYSVNLASFIFNEK